MAVAAALSLLSAATVRAADPEPADDGVGRAATAAEIRAWDIDVRPDFKGLPPGKGSVEEGQVIWDGQCAVCHGAFGESSEVFTPITGGITGDDIASGHVASLRTPDVRSTLSKVATVSTLWDYIYRAMPWNAPRSLSPDQTYAVLAYILNLGEILPADFVMSRENIAEVQARMPNRKGMTLDHGMWPGVGQPDVAATRCLTDCLPAAPQVTSSLPLHARDAHGELARQMRLVGATVGIRVETPPPTTFEGPNGTAQQAQASIEALRKAWAASPVAATSAADPASSDGPATPAALAGAAAQALLQKSGCLVCHDMNQAKVGPSYREVAKRYQPDAADPAVLAGLVSHMQNGGSGRWGTIPMPPQPALSTADATALGRWLLAGAPD